LREENRLRVFENRVLRKIFGPEREVDGSWRKLLNDELHGLYSSPNIFRVIKSRGMSWAGHVSRMGEGFFYRFPLTHFIMTQYFHRYTSIIFNENTAKYVSPS
jgi:hypothetical protein